MESIAHGGTSIITSVRDVIRSGILAERELRDYAFFRPPNLGFVSIEAAAKIYAGTREAVEAVLTGRCDFGRRGSDAM